MFSNILPISFFKPFSNNDFTPQESLTTNTDLTIVIDPNIFFINHAGIYHIHPILRTWFERIKLNPDLGKIRFYLLKSHFDAPMLTIGTGTNPFTITINQQFFDLLTDDSKNYAVYLWDGNVQIATRDPYSPFGISSFSDLHPITDEEKILVITADTELNDFFKDKDITVAFIDSLFQPILSTHFNELVNENNLEIYSDFDGTLLNTSDYILMHTIKSMGLNEIKTSEFTKVNLKEDEQVPSLLQEKTISLLKTLCMHKTYLITQRSYEIDRVQPFSNSANALINYINNHSANLLNIHVDESSFLDARKQLSEGDNYLTKIEILYQRLKKRSEHLRPKHIMLIDDDLREILKCELAKPYFKNLGIQITTALIMHPRYYASEYMEEINKHSPDLFVLIEKYYYEEMKKLNSAFEAIQLKQEVQRLAQQPVPQPNPLSFCRSCNLF